MSYSGTKHASARLLYLHHAHLHCHKLCVTPQIEPHKVMYKNNETKKQSLSG